MCHSNVFESGAPDCGHLGHLRRVRKKGIALLQFSKQIWQLVAYFVLRKVAADIALKVPPGLEAGIAELLGLLQL